MSAATIRAALLSECARIVEALRARDGQAYEDGKLVRAGVEAAREAIEGVPTAVTGAEYCASLRDALERARTRFQDHDEDGWALGGIRTVMNRLEAAERELR